MVKHAIIFEVIFSLAFSCIQKKIRGLYINIAIQELDWEAKDFWIFILLQNLGEMELNFPDLFLYLFYKDVSDTYYTCYDLS